MGHCHTPAAFPRVLFSRPPPPAPGGASCSPASYGDHLLCFTVLSSINVFLNGQLSLPVLTLKEWSSNE